MSKIFEHLLFHANFIWPHGQFSAFLGAPVIIGTFGLALFYIGVALGSIPIIGDIFWFFGTLWTGLAMLYFIGLGWFWLISMIYLVIISGWALSQVKQVDQQVQLIDTGKSYRIKKLASWAISVVASIYCFESVIDPLVSLFDVYNNELAAWSPLDILSESR